MPGPMNFAGFVGLSSRLGHLEGIFACQKVVFWLSSLYLGNKGFVFCIFKALDVKIVLWRVANS